MESHGGWDVTGNERLDVGADTAHDPDSGIFNIILITAGQGSCVELRKQ